MIHSVKSIATIITQPGHINVDFADVRSIMKGMGLAMMGTGVASGKNRAIEATKRAIQSSLLENLDIKKARGILLNVTGGETLSLHEINDAANLVYDHSDNAHVIIGSVIDPQLRDEVMVSVIATGFEEQKEAELPIVEEVVAPQVVHTVPEVQLAQKAVEPVQTIEQVLAETVMHTAAASVTESLQSQNSEYTYINYDIPAFLRSKQFVNKDGEQQ